MSDKVEETRLMLLNGATIDISYPEDIAMEVWEEMERAFSAQSLWFCGDWDDLNAQYMEHNLSYIDFKKVVGIV